MFSISKFIFFVFVLIFSSCMNANKNNKDNFLKEKFYKLENINENDIISYMVEKYDTNKMVFVKGGRFIFGSKKI